ncbi:cytochrome P450 [Jiella sp. M17.18]|uniref:cytochrome P450 n=1 Tax=Jiella sp. M17.18 TaxID=3234247 RepID=UPI0034DE94C6
MTAFVPVSLDALPAGAGRLAFVRRILRNPASAVPSEIAESRVYAPSFAKGAFAYVADADVLETVLVERPGDFPKATIDERILRPIFRDGLLLAEGEDWRWKRRLAAPVFSPAAMRGFLPEIVAPFAALTGRWTPSGATVTADISDAMKTATLAVIDRLLFAGRSDIDPERIKRHVDDYLDPVTWVVAYAMLRLPDWTPFPGRGKLLRARDAVRALLADFVRRRRAGPADVDDVCNRLLAAADPQSGRTLTDADMVDMLLTLISAGHETSANALTWAVYCLAEMPQTQERLIAEIDREVGSDPIDQPAVSRLVAVRAFLLETMRLFPPAPGLSRRTLRPETLGGIDLPAGAAVMIPVYAVHRHPHYWERPQVFDLDRFTEGREAAIRRTVYLPFGAGPRICVGGTLAMLEMTAGLATLLQRVRFLTVPGAAEPQLQHRVTLRPRHRLAARVEPRRDRPAAGHPLRVNAPANDVAAAGRRVPE